MSASGDAYHICCAGGSRDILGRVEGIERLDGQLSKSTAAPESDAGNSKDCCIEGVGKIQGLLKGEQVLQRDGRPWCTFRGRRSEFVGPLLDG